MDVAWKCDLGDVISCSLIFIFIPNFLDIFIGGLKTAIPIMVEASAWRGSTFLLFSCCWFGVRACKLLGKWVDVFLYQRMGWYILLSCNLWDYIAWCMLVSQYSILSYRILGQQCDIGTYGLCCWFLNEVSSELGCFYNGVDRFIYLAFFFVSRRWGCLFFFLWVNVRGIITSLRDIKERLDLVLTMWTSFSVVFNKFGWTCQKYLN